MTTQLMPEGALRYSYRLNSSVEDGEFVATCLEMPSLSWLAESPVEALRGLQDLVAEVIEDLRAEGESVPEPLVTRAYSGKFNLRAGPELHRRLAMEAAERHMSLNQYVVTKLSAAS